MSGHFSIGTSNIVLPGPKKDFPAAFQNKSRLHYYSTIFNSLEVNSSFYKVPLLRTFERWKEETLPEFRFSVKLWKGITHAKNLAYNPVDIDNFMLAANGIGEKKGCLLIQFPASIKSDYTGVVRQILQRIKNTDRGGKRWKIAVEFRHISWYTQATFSMLDKFKAGIVLHDMPSSKNETVRTKADFVMIRYHGMKGDYRGSYSRTFLKKEAGKINQWLTMGKDVYAYFNNTLGGAFENAKTLSNYIKP